MVKVAVDASPPRQLHEFDSALAEEFSESVCGRDLWVGWHF